MKTLFKLALHAILASSLAIGSTQAFAQSQDPLWIKSVQQLQNAQKYVARDIEQKVEAERGDEKKAMVMTIRQTAWKGKDPVYSVISVDPPPKDGRQAKPLDFEDVLKSVYKIMLDDTTPVKRHDGQAIEGKAATMFEIDQGGLQKFNAKIWVHPESGQVYHYNIQLAVPLLLELETQATLADSEAGVRVVRTRDSKFKIKIPFKKGSGHLNETLSNWVLRP